MKVEATASSRWWGSPAPMILAVSGLGVAAVAASSSHLATYPHGTVVFPWQFPAWVLFLVGLSGAGLAGLVARWPSTFWPAAVVTALTTSGIHVLRFPIYDEWLGACLVAGGAVAGWRGAVAKRTRLSQPLWSLLFFLLCVHLVLLAGAGFLIYGNVKALRFVGTFAVMGALGLLAVRYAWPTPGPRTVTVLVAVVASLYYVANLAHGYWFKPAFWANHELSMEGIGGAGGGHQMLLAVAAVPAALLLMADPRRRWQLLGGLSLLLGLAVTALADTRGGILPLVTGLAVAPFAIGVRPVAKFVALGLVASVVIGAVAFDRPQWPLDIGEATLRTFTVEEGAFSYNYFGRNVTAAHGDTGRLLFVRAGIEAAVGGDPLVALAGAGAYGYFAVAGDDLARLNAEHGVPDTTINRAATLGDVAEPPRPPALGAILVETGLVGTVLLLGCALAAALPAGPRTPRGPHLLVAASVGGILAWTYFGEIQDALLLYILVMPYGLAHVWSGNGGEAYSLKRNA